MHDAKTIAASSTRPASSINKYALLTALAIFGVRAILFVILRKTAISYGSDASLSFKTDDIVALIDTLVMGFVNLPFYAFVGWLISRKTGSVRTGLLTGLKAGFFSGMAIYVLFAIIAISIATLIVLLASAFPHNQNTFFHFGSNVTWWIVKAILVYNLLFIVFDMACGTLMGWLGAILGLL